jgi:hypothetical protein
MLQYLTDDLLLGYGLPKKRVRSHIGAFAVSLSESVLRFDDGTLIESVLQYVDVVAIGRISRLVYSLHADATIKNIGFGRSRVALKWDNLLLFLT